MTKKSDEDVLKEFGLMTAAEVATRLNGGESPLPLSVEKYVRMDRWAATATALDVIAARDAGAFGAGTCPLCMTYTTKCDGCPLKEAGVCCFLFISPYAAMDSMVGTVVSGGGRKKHLPQLCLAIKTMLNTLRSLQCPARD